MFFIFFAVFLSLFSTSASRTTAYALNSLPPFKYFEYSVVLVAVAGEIEKEEVEKKRTKKSFSDPVSSSGSIV